MKIDSLNFSYPIQSVYKKNMPMEENSQNNFQVKDSIEISDIGKSLSKMNTDDMNVEKINEIKSQIQSGTYNIDSKDLARKIISSFGNEKSQL